MGEAFGAAVTRANGKAAWALEEVGAKAPHPARRYPARSKMWKHLFIRYGAESGMIDIESDVSTDIYQAVGGSVRTSMGVRDTEWGKSG